LEFYFLKKNDNQGKILDNNSFGTNTKISLGENLNFTGQFGANISNVGFGCGFSLSASYTGQRYGAQTYFRKIFGSYVTPSNLLVEPDNWFQLTSYSRPLYWLNLSQEISYSSLQDASLGLNFAINKAPLPEFGYGISFSRRTESISQNIHSVWHYKKFSISSDYGWSRVAKNFGLRFNQGFKNLQFWSGLQIKQARIYQFGGNFPISTNLRFKSFFNYIKQNNQTSHTTGAELSLKLLKNFNLNSTYELVHHNTTNDHSISLSLSNTMLFDQVGFCFVTGKVFMDLNNNGIFDIEDQAVSDVEVILDGKETVRTDRNGNYQFSFVRGGSHSVGLNLRCLPAEIGTEKRREIVNTKFLDRARVYFPLGKLGIIEGYVFYDDNNDAKMNENEKGVPNVVLALNGYLTTTNENGKYRFANLVSGTYSLEVKILPPETFLSVPELPYIYIKPGERFSDFNLGVIKKERPVEKKVFEEQEIPPPPEKKPPKVFPKPKPQEKVSPEKVEELFNIGVSYFTVKRYDKALEFFNRVLALNPNHKEAKEYKRRTEARLKVKKE
ncbi:MAG: SdrD B-like domain-containing protein, partial [bacterium]